MLFVVGAYTLGYLFGELPGFLLRSVFGERPWVSTDKVDSICLAETEYD